MNISKIEKASQKYVFLAAVIGLTLFAGAKHGSETNDVDAVSSPRQEEDDPSDSDAEGTPRPQLTMLPPQTGNEPPLFDFDSQLQLCTNWTRRGAYCDWKRIDFPGTFAFPSGTNLLTGATLMAYGELRESLRGSIIASFSQLPTTSYQLTLLVSSEQVKMTVG